MGINPFLINNSKNMGIKKKKEENISMEENKEEKSEENKSEIEIKNSDLKNLENISNNTNNSEKEKEKEKENNKIINQVLEDMCNFGNIMKKEIKEEKEKNPEKFIEIEEALKKEEEDEGLFVLGLLAKNLEENGVETAIESEPQFEEGENEDNSDENNYNNNKDDKEEDAATTCLQFIINGMATKKKYILHFDLGEERNNELLEKKDEYNEFKEKLKVKLSKDFNIPIDKIIVTYPEKGSVIVQVIFESNEFNNLDKKEFLNKFRNENEDDFEELKKLKEIHEDVILSGCKLTKKQLDSRGNRKEGWEENGFRGNLPYDPPLGWIGIGLKVLDKYENNIWIGMENQEGEWCVAYHGVGRFQDSENVKIITGKIYKGGFKEGENQAYEFEDDENHPGKKVGKGVYCTPKISIAEEYSGISIINNISYKTVLMVRVNPKKRRYSKDMEDYWVVDGTTDEIRPYRILYKKELSD